MSFYTDKKSVTFSELRRRYFDKRIDKYMISFNCGTIYYDGISKKLSYFSTAKFNDIEYMKLISHSRTPYEVFQLCWKIHVKSKEDIIAINITKREY